jgi:hypothetical protein
MNSLEGRLIVISRLTTEGDELFSARGHVPLIIERDPARKVALAMSLADVPPQDRVDLLGRRRSRRCERVVSRIEPPCNCSRRTVALASVMGALYSDVAVTDLTGRRGCSWADDRFIGFSELRPGHDHDRLVIHMTAARVPSRNQAGTN